MEAHGSCVNTSLPNLMFKTSLMLLWLLTTPAHGPDGVPFVLYRKRVKFAAPIFLRIFNSTADGVKPPKEFNLGLLFLLPKLNTGFANDTRPISVTNCANRIVAKILVWCIMPALINCLHSAQKGSIPGRRGAEHIRALNELFYKAVEDERLLALFG